MNAADFTNWVDAQRALGAASQEVADSIGIGRSTMFQYMKEGSPKVVDLAIAGVRCRLCRFENKGDE